MLIRPSACPAPLTVRSRIAKKLASYCNCTFIGFVTTHGSLTLNLVFWLFLDCMESFHARNWMAQDLDAKITYLFHWPTSSVG